MATIDTEAVLKTSNLVAECAVNYGNKYENLLKNIDTFTATDWKGPDAEAFRTKVQGFRVDFNKMQELMEEYSSTLRKIAETYERAIEENIRKAKSMR